MAPTERMSEALAQVLMAKRQNNNLTYIKNSMDKDLLDYLVNCARVIAIGVNPAAGPCCDFLYGAYLAQEFLKDRKEIGELERLAGL